jgi:hypothetical protein
VTDLPEEQRKQVFLTLVVAQDQGLAVANSRRLIAEQFSLTENQVRLIEREGLENEWPPL